MTREQWAGRVKRILESLSTFSTIEKVEAPRKRLTAEGEMEVRSLKVKVDGVLATFMYGRDLHCGERDQFWLDVIWDHAQYGIMSHTLNEDDLMRESTASAWEIYEEMCC
jgi:hypothetical protein